MNQFGDYFQMDFTLVIRYSLDQKQNFTTYNVKNVSVRLSGRGDASLRANYDNYEIESAFLL